MNKETKHEQDSTHICCNNRLKKEGGKARCCICIPHKNCNLSDINVVVKNPK